MDIDSNVRTWYVKTYPDDPMGSEIEPGCRFIDVLYSLVYETFYETIGAIDTVVRERVFTKLADIIGADYELIYDLWIG